MHEECVNNDKLLLFIIVPCNETQNLYHNINYNNIMMFKN